MRTKFNEMSTMVLQSSVRNRMKSLHGVLCESSINRIIPTSSKVYECKCNRSFTATRSNSYQEDDIVKGQSPPIYIAATQEHVGKTTTSLALLSGLLKRFPKAVGYLKPVGQKHVPVHSKNLDSNIRVDKDVALIRELFNLENIDYQHMSPVLIPPGYTKDYIDGKFTLDGQLKSIHDAFQNVSRCNEMVLCEGTGHCGVGSIVDVSNAKVASYLGAYMILVANGGLGKFECCRK